MDSFCRKVVEYMYETKLVQFISSFYELYLKLGEEGFIFYFPPSAVITSLGELKRSKEHLIRTYVRTYWSFCRNPKRYPVL